MKNTMRGLAIGFLFAVVGVAILSGVTSITPSPGYGVKEETITVGDSARMLLAPPGNLGFFIQPQTEGATIRVGFGASTTVSSTEGVIVQYLEALAEQPRPGRTFHEVWAQSTSGDVDVRVVLYQ